MTLFHLSEWDKKELILEDNACTQLLWLLQIKCKRYCTLRDLTKSTFRGQSE